jgi:hypothetical protein
LIYTQNVAEGNGGVALNLLYAGGKVELQTKLLVNGAEVNACGVLFKLP